MKFHQAYTSNDRLPDQHLLHQNIYKTIIPRNVRLAEAPSHGLPINLYEPKSAGADGYRSLADEVINRGKEEE